MKFSKNRLEQFSDGVMAIIVTIMVLNVPLPKSFGYNDIMSLLLSILVFFVSFFIVGFFWHQHYRLFHVVEEITNKASWRNLLFLFLLSLMPIFTKWVIENLGEAVPCIGYVSIFVLVNVSYRFLFRSVIENSAFNKMRPPHFSMAWVLVIIWILIIAGAIVLSFYKPLIASILLIGLPLFFSIGNMWFENDRDIKNRGRRKPF